MAGITRGTFFLSLSLFLVLIIFCISIPGCLGMQESAKVSAPPSPVTTATAPVPAPPSIIPTLPTPRHDPIVGTWYAPFPDDLTFEFHPDGTFTERSPNFATYQGTWTTSEENFYDASILDPWGYKKPAHFLLATGTLYTKGIGAFHRVA